MKNLGVRFFIGGKSVLPEMGYLQTVCVEEEQFLRLLGEVADDLAIVAKSSLH